MFIIAYNLQLNYTKLCYINIRIINYVFFVVKRLLLLLYLNFLYETQISCGQKLHVL